MKSNVTLFKHPVHPILVLIPVGAWVSSLVLDIACLATGNGFWFAASFWLIVIGVWGAIIAAIAGLWDLFTLPMTDEPKKTGLRHMVTVLIVTAIYIVNSAVIRVPAMASATQVPGLTQSTIAWAFGLNVMAVVLLAVAGWLGGELVYRYGVAVPRETLENAHRYEAVRMGSSTGMAGSLGGESIDDEEQR